MRFSLSLSRPITSFLIIFPLLLAPLRAPLHGAEKQTITEVNDDSNNWWSTGGTAMQDGAFTAVSASLIGWGLGAVAAIAIVAALFGSESGSHSH